MTASTASRALRQTGLGTQPRMALRRATEIAAAPASPIMS